MYLDLEEFGHVEVGELIHRGSLFEVHQVRAKSGILCLKIPVQEPRSIQVFQAHHSVYFTRFLSLICESGQVFKENINLPESTAQRLLEAEAKRIYKTQGAWNHQALKIVNCDWHGQKIVGLVTPFHAGTTLAQMDRATQRRLFPRMLLALWDALTVTRHGDLSASNIIIHPRQDKFTLIDPGVFLSYHWEHVGDSRTDVMFTTNPGNYPIIPPYAFQVHPLSEQKSLEEHLKIFAASMTGKCCSEQVYNKGGVEGYAFYPSLSNFLKEFRSDSPVELHQFSDEPHISDLLALGVIYYYILTQQHPFFDAHYSQPAWLGAEGDDFNLNGFEACFERLQRKLVKPSDIVASIHPAEDELCLALLKVQLSSRSQLFQLVINT